MNIEEATLTEIRKQSLVFESISENQNKMIELLREISDINREMLNFFIAIEENESGEPSTFNKEYLAEINKEGSTPPRG